MAVGSRECRPVVQETPAPSIVIDRPLFSEVS
jgi:hypothetical protein